jgi:hypothetical protein
MEINTNHPIKNFMWFVNTRQCAFFAETFEAILITLPNLEYFTVVSALPENIVVSKFWSYYTIGVGHTREKFSKIFLEMIPLGVKACKKFIINLCKNNSPQVGLEPAR